MREPCEKLKGFLRDRGVDFLEEVTPNVEGRFFSLDIAIPEKRIAIEVNGNQHYDTDGNLKPYYQERHDLVESIGWNVMEVHFKDCYIQDRMDEILRCVELSESYSTLLLPTRRWVVHIKMESLPEIESGSKA